MKKILSIFFLLVCLSPAFALTYDQLTPDEQQTYLKQALSVQTSQTTNTDVVTTSQTVGHTGFGIGIGSATSDTSLDWIPFLGSDQISKAKFFNIVGEDKLSKDALDLEDYIADQKEMEKVFEYSGFSVSVIGLGIMLVALGKMQSDPDGALDLCTTGSIIACAGVGVMCISLPFAKNAQKKQNVSIDFVIKTTNNYNQKLMDQLSK